VLATFAAGVVGAQGGAPARSERTAEGRLRRATERAPATVPGQWVVLHRVGTDRAAPLDSVQSDAAGRYRFRYTATGDPDALYFVSTSWLGIAYFSSPLREAVVRGGDADLLVFDTTSSTASLRVQGRHVILSAASGSKRDVTEVFEIENDGRRTVVARDAKNPLWATRFPTAAESLTVAPGDLGAGAVSFREGRGELYAPISPGVRQLVVTYRLPAGAFPLTLPLEVPVSVLEVLLEDPRAAADGAGLAESAPVAIDGRNFRRFLSRDVPAATAIRIRAEPPGGRGQTATRVLAVVAAVLMGGALVWWSAQRRAVPLEPAVPESEVLIAELATLDARFRRSNTSNGATRSEYERSRAALKDRIARALAAEQARS